jgi:hypothetical protein
MHPAGSLPVRRGHLRPLLCLLLLAAGLRAAPDRPWRDGDDKLADLRYIATPPAGG